MGKTIDTTAIKTIVIACDAGMGSSVMLAAQLSGSLSRYGVTVLNAPVDRIPASADLVLCHEALAPRARMATPGKAVLGFRLFVGDPLFGKLEQAIRDGMRFEY